MGASRWSWLLCVFTVCAAPAEDKKKLRNVIITSFGEMPYEPADGFYQSDVFPVDIDGVVKDQTMDVALRTRILVEDPNEGKQKGEDEEEDETSTNYNEQVSAKKEVKREGEPKESLERRGFKDEQIVKGTRNFRDKGKDKGERERSVRMSPERNPKEYEEEIIVGTRKLGEEEGPMEIENERDLPVRRAHKRNPKGYGEGITGRRSFGYDFEPPKKPSTRNNDVNRWSPRDIGEGWNLQDAEAILQGRNYNLLVQPRPPTTLHHSPAPREMPPPMFAPYPFPHQFDYGFPPPGKYNTRIDRPPQFRDKREWVLSTLSSEPRAMRLSTPHVVLYSDDYLRGI